jgi:hypothetical protein
LADYVHVITISFRYVGAVVLACAFPLKIELFRYDTKFFLHSSMYDNYRRPAHGRHRGGSGTKSFKKTLPACLGEALRRGSSYSLRFSGFRSEPPGFMTVSAAPWNLHFSRANCLTSKKTFSGASFSRKKNAIMGKPLFLKKLLC